MAFTKSQLAIIGAVVFLIFTAVLMFFRVIPGLKAPVGQAITLRMWGIEPLSAISPAFDAFKSEFPKFNIEYRSFPEETYEDDLVNGLATGQGPDIFMFHSSWLPRHKDKIAPFPQTKLSFEDFSQKFPEVIIQDFSFKNTIYASPLYLDTLALFFNRTIFERFAVVFPPHTREEFDTLAIRMTSRGANGAITVSGASLGAHELNVLHASDILKLFLLERGALPLNFPVSSVYNQISGAQALSAYTQFANPQNVTRTWDASLPQSREYFAQGNVAMMFGYASDVVAIRNINPALRFDVAPLPQLQNTTQSVTTANYYGLAVSAISPRKSDAWDAIIQLTTNETIADTYFKASGRPPALKTLISTNVNNREIGTFIRQALIARSWRAIDHRRESAMINEAIQSIISGQSTPDNASKLLESKMKTEQK